MMPRCCKFVQFDACVSWLCRGICTSDGQAATFMPRCCELIRRRYTSRAPSDLLFCCGSSPLQVLLAATEPAVVLQGANWRKLVHYLHSNSFSQSFMISVAEWSALRGVEVKFEGALVSLQKVAVQFAFRRSERITRPIIIHCFVTSCHAPFLGTKGGAMG